MVAVNANFQGVQPQVLRNAADDAEQFAPPVQEDIQAANAVSPPGLAQAGPPPGADTQAPTPGAAPQGSGPVTPTEGGGDPESHMMNFFRDPKRLAMAAMLAAQHNRPDVANWLHQGFQAQQENTMEALQALMSGDKQRAIDTFNLAGKFKATSIDDGKEPGTYDVTMADGTQRTIHPANEYFNLLTPPQRANMDVRNQVADMKLQAAQMMANARMYGADSSLTGRLAAVDAKLEQVKSTADLNQARTELAQAQAELARAKTSNATGETTKPWKPTDWNRAETAVRAAATDASTPNDPDPTTGRVQTDRGKAALLHSWAMRIMQDDAKDNNGTPSIDPATAVTMAKNKWGEAQDTASGQVDSEVAAEKKKAGTGMFGGQNVPDWKSKGARNEQEFRARRTRELAERSMAAVPGGANVSPANANPAAPSNDPLGIRGGAL